MNRVKRTKASENGGYRMKKRNMGPFIAMGGIALVLIIASIFLIVSSSYTARLVLVNDGFFVGEQVHDCLYANDESAVVTSIPAIGASQSDILYEKSGKYFLGDDYTPVSLNFPYVINNASAVMFTSSVDKLITGTFEYVDSYENLYMSGGVTFNADMERAYREDFILVDAGNGIYMNADKLTVGGSLTTSGEIPANSFIRFMENEIGYYYYDNDALIYARIAPVSRTATISIGGYSYTYIEFLEKLGLYTERKAKDKTTPTPTPLSNEEDDEVEPAGERQVFVFGDSDADEGNDNEDNNGDADRQSSATGSGRAEETGDTEETEITDESERDDDEEREMITPDPGERPTRAPRPTRVPSQPEPAEEPLPAEDQGTRVTPTPRPTATPLPTPTLIPAIEKTASGEDPIAPAPAAAAAPAAPVAAKPAPPAPVRVSTGSAVRPIIFDEWKMPEVTVGEITTGVFTIFLDNFHIDHVKYIDPRSGVMFNVKEADTDKLVLAKSVMSGGPVRLSAPFKPETGYTIEIILHYLNEFGEAKEKKVLEYGTVYTTLDRSKLDALDLKAEKGQREPDFFHLLNLHIGIAYENAQLETPRYIESLEFLGRVEIEAINKNDDKDVRKFTLSSSDLRNLRNGVINPDYKSAKVFRSNSEYEYTIRATDRTGGTLLFELADGTKTTEYKGSFKTCSGIPKASFTVRNNRIFDYTVAVRISNPGNAQLKNNVKFRVCDISDPDIEDAVVQTTVQYLNTTAGGTPVFDDEETDTEHEFPAVLLDGLYDPTAVQGAAEQFVEILIKFTDLSAQSIYRLDVYGDCDIYRVDREECESDEDYENKRWSHEIFGSNKFTTASLASLGNLFLDNRIPAENENLEEGTLYMTLSIGERTDDLLVKLLDRIELGLSYNKKDENGEETGEYIKDTDAKISFAIVDRESTDLVDATSVVAHERPDKLEEYENEASRLAQIAYNNIINNTERYNKLLDEIEKAAGRDAEAQYDEDGNPLTYSAYKEKFNDANAVISTGNYGEDTPEYEQYQADIAAFEDLVKTLENEANALLRQEAEDERAGVRLVEYDNLLAGRSKGYTTENLSFKAEVEEGQYQVDLNELRRRVGESESASGSAITYKYAKELRIAITGLKTDTMYRIDAEGYATTNMKTDRIARTLLTMSTFRTYKKKAIVSMDAYYAGASFISFFGLKIVDPDGAISEYPVEMVLTDSLGQIMGSRTFKGPDQSFEEVRFGSLTTNEWHYLTFKATGYNKGWTKSSAEINREIFVNDNTETLKVITRESIKANISLLGINDAYDLADEVRVFVDSAKTNIKTLQGRTTATSQLTTIAISNLTYKTNTNGKQYTFEGDRDANRYIEARYKLEVDFGNEEYNIIEPCIRPMYNRYTRYEVYSDSGYTDLISVVDKNAEVRVSYGSGSATALNRGYWTSNYIRLTRKLTGRETIYVKAVAINGVSSGTSKGVYPLVGFSFHKFGENAYTANINAVIEDEFGQLSNGSISSYIIRVYEKEGEATSEDLGYTLISERVHAWNEIDNYSGVGDNCNLKMYTREQWDETSGKGTPDLGEKTFYGTANTINTDFGIFVNKDKYYRMELWVMINNYSIRLGTSGFTSDRMIHSIENEDDLIDAYCHPSDSYIVMNDITTSKTNIYTTTQFDGVIDFNGHKLTHLAGSYLIHTLGAYGELRNIVYEKGNGGNHNYVNMLGLLYYNYGLVNGIQVIYNNGLSDKILKSSSYVDGLIAYQNYPTGIIENFSIELKKDIWFYGADGVSLAVWLNYGMLRNGYCCATAVEGEEYENGNPTVYANDITVDQNGGYPAIYMLVKLDDIKKVITTEVTAKSTYTQNYITGGLCRINRDGIIENVFTNIDMYLRSNDGNTRYKRGASICGRNEGLVRNSFSASRVYYYKENVTPSVFVAKNKWSPASLNFIEGANTYGHSANVYHYDMGLGYGVCIDVDKFSIDSTDIRKELLYDHNWYEVLFNESGSTSPNQWDYEMLTRSCFPHVVMSENMPDQPLVKLPALSQSSIEISVLAANVYQQEDTSALATITFYNPNGFLVRDITIDYLKTTIITQWNEGKFYYVRVELSDPVKFYTGYKLTGFTFSNRNGSGRQTGNMHEKTVDVNAEFFGLIYTIQDFRNMSDGLDQNYKLGRDIDFSGYDAKDYALGRRKTNGDLDTVYKTDDNNNCFKGQFEGNNKTLRNIDVGNTGFLFGKVAGPIRNLYIENIHTPSTEAYGAQKSTATYMGVVAVLRLGGSIENVHVRGAKFENVTQYGGVLLARNFYENQIKNCSVQDAVLTTGMPVENATAASVGGICGHNDLGLQIHNCFVDGITIMAEQAGDIYGVGGLVGYTVQGIEIENVYVVHGRIETNFSNVGGLVGSVQSMNDVNNTSKQTLYTSEYFLSNFYEDVEIITMANNVGGVIGYTSKVSGTDWAYGVNFGAIVSKSNGVDVKTLNPIVGFYTSATAADYNKGLSGKRFGKHNYIYSSYQMDGEDYITTSRFKADTAQETEEKRESHFKSIDYATLTSSDSYGYKDALIRPILGWRDNFIIDQDDLSKGIMPKLYYTDDVTDIHGNRIELPGQKGFSLQKDEVEVTYAHYLDDDHGGSTDDGRENFVPEVLIKVDHDEGINITGAGFEGCVWGKDEQQQDMFTIQKTSATQTEIRGSLKIFENFGGENIPYAKDKFFLTKIYYDRPVVSGGAIVAGLYEPKVKDVYRDIGLRSRWVTIRTVSDWNRFMSQDGSATAYGDRGFNVRLAPANGELDFKNNVNWAASRVKINHLIGMTNGNDCGIDLSTMTGTYNADCAVTIKNLFLYDDELSTGNSNCLIEQATGKIYGINFENCTVSQTYKGAVAGGKVSNKTNIIGVVNGDIDHVSFKNVDILAFKSANIAPIGLAYGVSTNIKLEDVNIVQMRTNGTYISNYSNRAGYVSFLGKFAGVNGVNAKRVYVDAAGAYLGGVVGKQVGGCYLWDINGRRKPDH